MMQSMLEIFPVPAFSDNYIWLIKRGAHAAVVDPGDAAPVMETLKRLSLQLDAILITHHHSDHIGGVVDLLKQWPVPVYAPQRGHYDFAQRPVAENDVVYLATLDLVFTVMEVPGHTLDHVAYYGANSVFCGDTLFGAGCGRLFEGTPAQMYASLQRLAGLPTDTQVFCAHEYTEHNIRFARRLDPGNPILARRQAEAMATRQAGQPSLPSNVALELATNPFLRCETKAIQAAAGLENADAVQVFSVIRQLRNHY